MTEPIHFEINGIKWSQWLGQTRAIVSEGDVERAKACFPFDDPVVRTYQNENGTFCEVTIYKHSNGAL